MDKIVIIFSLALLGLCFGSFAGATVWRLRAKQLRQDKHDGEKYDKKQYGNLKKLLGKSIAADRSRCLDCGYVLKWYDLLPMVSWISLGGRCRRCRKPIGMMEPLIELGVALYFVLSYIYWPFALVTFSDMSIFGLWLISGIGLAIMFAYDLRWLIIPDEAWYFVLATSFLSAALRIAGSGDIAGSLINLVLCVSILSGLYLLVFIVSKGAWVGFADIKLGLVLSLLIIDWQLALMTIFLANLIGCIIIIPGLLSGKLTRTSKVPFGPLLITGAFIAMLFGKPIIVSLFGSLL